MYIGMSGQELYAALLSKSMWRERHFMLTPLSIKTTLEVPLHFAATLESFVKSTPSTFLIL